MTQEEYLEAEFRRYFPTATSVAVTSDDEKLTVCVKTPDVAPWYFHMEVGSDDDWYEFMDVQGVILTIPLQADNGN